MSKVPADASNSAQIDYWNAAAGKTWAQHQDRLDRQIEPLGLEAIRALAPLAGERMLDVGCGCGQTTFELAARVGVAGHVTGVDISAPMLAVAKTRSVPTDAAPPEFLQLDAQTADLGHGVYDAVFSRFGVMFFSDPTAAFANLRRALTPNGRLAFVCWRPLQDNLWMRAPMEAALPFLPTPTPADPLAPGPFAFASADRIRSILSDAGFAEVTLHAFNTSIGGASLDQTVNLAFRVGPLGAVLREKPELRAAVSGYETPSGVLMPASVWIVRAQAS
ncbi:class I SAM-dependent methyltransferase [Phenylobacterium sp.]|uniref:class I SAM-dependent methyltransferase n=1 Tax=Phenylobacterium sp. TaxID=1871053 RepID=UPI00356863FA